MLHDFFIVLAFVGMVIVPAVLAAAATGPANGSN
jgi:hypothetical protein